MDGQRFDELAKNLATALPRRTVLRDLGGLVVGLLAAGRAGPEGASAQRTCGGPGGVCGSDRECCPPGICTGGHCCPADRTFCKGKCVQSCGAGGQCLGAGVLDPNTCTCTFPPARDFTRCDDGNLCTRDDVCIQGVCVGRDPVICPGAGSTEQCKTQGTCDPATGQCIGGGNVADGTLCNDLDPCTRRSTCQGGKCVGFDYVLTCDKGFVCIKDVNGQFICAKKNDVRARDLHPD